MKLILSAALLWAALAFAAPVIAPTDAPIAAGQAGGSTDDEEDETPAAATPKPATPAPTPKPLTPGAPTGVTPPPAAAAPAPAPAATQAPATTAPPPPAEQMRLVSGAPLNNPNVGVHIVEQKTYSDSGKREVVVYPVAAQVNGKFTQHFGTMGSFLWHLQENFGLQLTGGYNWFNSESSFNGELVEKVREEAQAASSLLWVWGVLGGVEVVPVYGKFALFEGTLARFSLVVNGGAGIGGTRHQLKPESVAQDGSVSPATFGDTGFRFMGSIGAGLRLQLGERFAFRMELHDVVYTARVERVNGCNVDDLKAMDAVLRMGREPGTATGLSGSCNVDTFSGTYEGTSMKRSNDVPLALNLVKNPSSDVLSNLGLYVGAAFLF